MTSWRQAHRLTEHYQTPEAVNKERIGLSVMIRALPDSARDITTPSSDLSPRSIPSGRLSSSTGSSIPYLTTHGMHCDGDGCRRL